MTNKYFSVNNPTQVVTITSDHDNFYLLSDGNMIKKETFMTKYQPTLDGFENDHTPKQNIPTFSSNSTIDVDSFFSKSSVSADVISVIKNVDETKVSDIKLDPVIKVNLPTDKTINQQPQQPQFNMNESLVTRVDNVTIPNNTNTNVSQYKVYDDDEESYNDFLNKPTQIENRPLPPVVVQTPNNDALNEINVMYDNELLAFGKEEADSRKNKRMLKLYPQTQQNNTQQPQQPYQQPVKQIDPVTMMFSTFKRNHELTINLQFKDKIGSPDFIKMMVENMDGDIVGYYKNIIMENIKKDLSKIEDVVQDEIEIAIYGEVISRKIVKQSPKKSKPKMKKPKLDEGKNEIE